MCQRVEEGDSLDLSPPVAPGGFPPTRWRSGRDVEVKVYRVKIPPRFTDKHLAASISCRAAKYLRTSTMSDPSFHRSTMSVHLSSGHLKNHSLEYPSPVVTRQHSIKKYPCANAASPIFVVDPLNAVSVVPNVFVTVALLVLNELPSWSSSISGGRSSSSYGLFALAELVELIELLLELAADIPARHVLVLLAPV
jgi:hypothetical protein